MSKKNLLFNKRSIISPYIFKFSQIPFDKQIKNVFSFKSIGISKDIEIRKNGGRDSRDFFYLSLLPGNEY